MLSNTLFKLAFGFAATTASVAGIVACSAHDEDPARAEAPAATELATSAPAFTLLVKPLGPGFDHALMALTVDERNWALAKSVLPFPSGSWTPATATSNAVYFQDLNGTLDRFLYRPDGTLSNGSLVVGGTCAAGACPGWWRPLGVASIGTGSKQSGVLWSVSNTTVYLETGIGSPLLPVTGACFNATGNPNDLCEDDWAPRTLGDFDGDGSTDIVWQNTSGALRISYLGSQGGEIFATRVTSKIYPDMSVQPPCGTSFDVDGSACGGNYEPFTTVDLNGDGRLDIASYNRGTHQLAVLFQDGNGGFRASLFNDNGWLTDAFPYGYEPVGYVKPLILHIPHL